MKKLPIFVMTAATLAVAYLAIPSAAGAGTHQGLHNGYAYGAWHGQRYGYAARYWHHGRVNSNLNPDRQMVGIGE